MPVRCKAQLLAVGVASHLSLGMVFTGKEILRDNWKPNHRKKDMIKLLRGAAWERIKKLIWLFFHWFNQSDFLLIVYHNLADKWGANWKTGLPYHQTILVPRHFGWIPWMCWGSLVRGLFGSGWWSDISDRHTKKLVRIPSLRHIYI